LYLDESNEGRPSSAQTGNATQNIKSTNTQALHNEGKKIIFLKNKGLNHIFQYIYYLKLTLLSN
jgi:hypothetical protein